MLVRLLPALIVFWIISGPVIAGPDDDAVRHRLNLNFYKPESRLLVDPVVVAGGHAIAGWSQGDMGGRALLRKRDADWEVVLCAGDELKKPETLRKAGIPADQAARLAADVTKAEARLPSERLALFSKFEGLVMVAPQTGHGPHNPSSHGHKP
jgi:hypothetical protein